MEPNFLYSVEASQKGSKSRHPFYITGFLIAMLAANMVFIYADLSVIANYAGNETNFVG